MPPFSLPFEEYLLQKKCLMYFKRKDDLTWIVKSSERSVTYFISRFSPLPIDKNVRIFKLADPDWSFWNQNRTYIQIEKFILRTIELLKIGIFYIEKNIFLVWKTRTIVLKIIFFTNFTLSNCYIYVVSFFTFYTGKRHEYILINCKICFFLCDMAKNTALCNNMHELIQKLWEN